MAIARMKSTVTLRATAECPTHSRADVAIRDIVFMIDEPTERGGTNTGPTPTDTAIAALVGCTNVIGHKCAARLGADIGRLSIEATCTFDRRGVTLEDEIEVPFQAIHLKVISHGSASIAMLQQVARETARFCPLSKLFVAAGTAVSSSWELA